MAVPNVDPLVARAPGPAQPMDEPLADRNAWHGLWVLAAALAMIVLDGTIVAVALPAIISGLHLSLTDAQWVNSLYSVVFAALLLTAGRMGDRFGRRRLLLIGLSAFVAGSILAALSGDATALLTARAIQGVGGSMVLPATLSTVNATFRGRDRAAAFGVWGAVMAGAAAIGPLLGGVLTEVASWQFIFWVNVPIGVVVFACALRYVTPTRAETATTSGSERRADIAGPVLSAIGFGLIVFALIEATSLGWWIPTGELRLGGFVWPARAPISPVPVALFAGLVTLAAFAVVEWRRGRAGRSAILDVRLFKITTFTIGNATALLVAVGEFALLFVLPLYLVTSLGLSTLSSGLVLAAMACGALVSGGAARHVAARLGAPRVVLLGLGMETLGAAASAIVVGNGGSGWLVALTLLPYGLGLGLASAQLTSTVLRDVPPGQSGAGSATQSTARQLGSALGSALGGSVLAGTLAGAGVQAAASPTAFAVAAGWSIWAAVAVLLVGLTTSFALAWVSNRGPARTV